MAVTKQTYNLNGTWTASQLADLVKQAFIDAGYMTDWFDSFTSGTVENRIWRVVNNVSATYGTVYYWFMFTTSGIFVSSTLTWNATTHVPTGTQYRDYFSTTTNSTTNHTTLLTASSTVNTTITRYTSQENTSATWFVFRNSTNSGVYLFTQGAFTANASINQNVWAYTNIITPSVSTSQQSSYCFLYNIAHQTRRTWLGGGTKANTFKDRYVDSWALIRFAAFGNTATIDNQSLLTVPSVWLPVAHTASDSYGATTAVIPVYTGYPIHYSLPLAPNDFAIAPCYESTLPVLGDTYVITAGTEEYEILASSNAGGSKILLMVRTV